MVKPFVRYKGIRYRYKHDWFGAISPVVYVKYSSIYKIRIDVIGIEWCLLCKYQYSQRFIVKYYE